MKTIWSVLTLMFVVLGCHGVVRDATVYQTEVSFMEQASLQEADSLALLVKTYCKCTTNSSDGSKGFTTLECTSAAKKSVLVKSRIPWHTEMMIYNAGLSNSRPTVDPPTVPSPTTLCP